MIISAPVRVRGEIGIGEGRGAPEPIHEESAQKQEKKSEIFQYDEAYTETETIKKTLAASCPLVGPALLHTFLHIIERFTGSRLDRAKPAARRERLI